MSNRRSILAMLFCAAIGAGLAESAEAQRGRKRKSGGRSSGGGAQRATGGGTSFSSCKEARAAGYSRMRRGEPGYSSRLDRDGDGVACE